MHKYHKWEIETVVKISDWPPRRISHGCSENSHIWTGLTSENWPTSNFVPFPVLMGGPLACPLDGWAADSWPVTTTATRTKNGLSSTFLIGPLTNRVPRTYYSRNHISVIRSYVLSDHALVVYERIFIGFDLDCEQKISYRRFFNRAESFWKF